MATLFAGLDVADKTTSICVLNASGEIVLETSVETTAAAIVGVLKPHRRLISKIGHESGCKATWLHKQLLAKKLPVICLDAWHTHAALAANRNKTDTNDARGIAEVLCRGIYTTAYVRSDESQQGRELLTHRRGLVRKYLDLELVVNSTLKLAGARLVKDGGKYVVRSLNRRGVAADLQEVLHSTLRALDALKAEIAVMDRLVQRRAEADPVCRRLMTVPGVGPITAFAFRTAIDDPGRFTSSRDVAAHFGLTPRTWQSGESSTSGGITKRGDGVVRSLLYQSAGSLINRSKSQCRLRLWALRLRERKCFKVAAVACARRMAVIMHRMWVTETDFKPAH